MAQPAAQAKPSRKVPLRIARNYLILGVLPNLVIAIGRIKTPGLAAENLYACGIATLTLGSLLKGVLQIYGTTNTLLEYYWLVGAGFTGLGIIFYFAQKKAVART